MFTAVLHSIVYAKDKLKLKCRGFCDFERVDNILTQLTRFLTSLKQKLTA